jgi:hypothetical protein
MSKRYYKIIPKDADPNLEPRLILAGSLAGAMRYVAETRYTGSVASAHDVVAAFKDGIAIEEAGVETE